MGTNLDRRSSEERVVTISSVDMSNSRVTAIDQYGATLQVSIDSNNPIVMIPSANEKWIADRSGVVWHLTRRYDTGQEMTSLSDLNPGDIRSEALGTLYLNGNPVSINGFDTNEFAPLNSPVFTGTPIAPTASVDTNTEQIATTAFVLDQASSTSPVPDSPSAAVGTSLRYARADHVHPAVSTSSSGILSGRPSASSSNLGGFYWATDQAVLYFSTGVTWLRTGSPAGATTLIYSASIPAGWVAYDGTSLPSTTGIYADIFSHLGSSTTPDTRGRTLVAQGTNADVNAIGNSDGVAVGTRSPKHNSTNSVTVTGAPAIGSLAVGGAPAVGSLTLPNHAHSDTISFVDTGHFMSYHGDSGSFTGNPTGNDNHFGDGWSGSEVNGPISQYAQVANLSKSGSVGNPTSNPAVTGAPAIGSLAVTGAPAIGTLAAAGSVGPGGTRPTDTPAYITFSVVIAKL